jgi:hypothetical protein
MGITINRNIFSEGGMKNREQTNLLKEKLILYLIKAINEENVPEGFNAEPGTPLDEVLQPIIHP